MSSTTVQKTRTSLDWKIWFQWIFANTLAETVGLGATLLIGAFLLVNAEQTIGAIPAAALGVLPGSLGLTGVKSPKSHSLSGAYG